MAVTADEEHVYDVLSKMAREQFGDEFDQMPHVKREQVLRRLVPIVLDACDIGVVDWVRIRELYVEEETLWDG